MGQLLAIDGNLGLIGAESERESVPAGCSGEPLHGQTVGRLNSQALLGPPQQNAHVADTPEEP